MGNGSIHIDHALKEDMKRRDIDVEMTIDILRRERAGQLGSEKPVRVSGIPGVDGQRVIDLAGQPQLEMSSERAGRRLLELGVRLTLEEVADIRGGVARFGESALREVGIKLLPYVAYGVLNGGSATSYADEKKNRGFSEPLYQLLSKPFERMAAIATGRPKGVTPAFLQPDGTPGPSFLELKLRALLIAVLAGKNRTGSLPPEIPFFQMSSVSNNAELAEAFRAYRDSPYLADLIEKTGVDPTTPFTGVQPMVAALTHSDEGLPREVFDRAYGTPGRTLPLPGGHGQNFSVLRSIYRTLREAGMRYAYLGNVDNLGYTPDPIAVAVTALRGAPASFEFSFRTPVDVKGGILVEDEDGILNCGDIGAAVSKEYVSKTAQAGTPILFNCATGLFDLEYLTNNIDRIVETLPIRISDQDKDAGRYAQAEQVTWEVIGMIDQPLIMGVNKYHRFLAAKLLLETLMTSGAQLGSADYPTADDPAHDLRTTAAKLHAGLQDRLESAYGLELAGGRWRPRSARSLESDMPRQFAE